MLVVRSNERTVSEQGVDHNMGKNSFEGKTDVAMAEDAGHVVDEQILDLDQRIQDLVAVAPPFYQNKNLRTSFVSI
ncbi:hexose transporter [Fusarium coicis]|nr:hexose transporter [Fusarium coicis]